MIAHHIDGMLQEAEVQHRKLQEAQAKPWVLDDSTVNRVIQVYRDQLNDLWLFDEQLTRWKAGTATEKQLQEIERLVLQMRKLHEVIAAILALAEALNTGTIEKQMAKSDEQLGLEFLMRMLGTSEDGASER